MDDTSLVSWCYKEEERFVRAMRRIALIIPHTDITLETDLERVFSNDTVVHTERLWLDEVGEEAEKRMVDIDLPNGTKYLKGITTFDCVVFGCTSASAVYGRSGLVRLESKLSDEFNCRSISALGAVLDYLDVIDIERLGLVTPYTDEVNAFMKKSMKEFGYPIAFCTGLGLIEDGDIARVEPDAIYDFVMTHEREIKGKCDSLFISCTNFRSYEVRERIEKDLGIKTITSNHCICEWINENCK